MAQATWCAVSAEWAMRRASEAGAVERVARARRVTMRAAIEPLERAATANLRSSDITPRRTAVEASADGSGIPSRTG